MAFEDLEIYLTSALTANRRDKPYAVNTVGSPLDFGGGSSGLLEWAADDNRRSWGRLDGSQLLYYELEVLSATSIRVYRTTLLGYSTTEDVTVSAGSTVATLVHGVSVVLAGTLTAGHKARVYPAIAVLDSNLFYLVRGESGDNVRIVVRNPGTESHVVSSLRVGRAAWYVNNTGSPILGVHTLLDTVTPDVYAVTITNGTSSGKKYTFTGVVNTYTADNVAEGATSVPLDDVATTGVTFDAGTGLLNTQGATIYVSDLADGLQLAPDNAGTPGTWVSWNDSTALSIPLNVAGSSDQVIPAAQTITAWVRWNGDALHPVGRGLAKMYTRSHEAGAE